VANQLHVEVVAVEEKVWAGEAEVRVKLAGGEQLTYDVAGGFLSIDANGVTVLAESATPATPESH
jgi:F-type H+-transporting ATPase subunit epsilon